MSYVMDLTISAITKCFLQFSNSLIHWVLAVWLHVFLLRFAQYLLFFILFVFLVVCVFLAMAKCIWYACSPRSMMLFFWFALRLIGLWRSLTECRSSSQIQEAICSARHMYPLIAASTKLGLKLHACIPSFSLCVLKNWTWVLYSKHFSNWVISAGCLWFAMKRLLILECEAVYVIKKETCTGWRNWDWLKGSV